MKKLAEDARPDDLALFTRAAKDMASIVRGEAASALGKSQDPRVVDLLGELLEDSDVDVQGQAAMALAQVKNDKAKAYLTLQYGRRGRQTRQVIVQALIKGILRNVIARCFAVEGMVAFGFHLICQEHELWYRGQEYRGGFSSFTGTHEATDCLGKK